MPLLITIVGNNKTMGVECDWLIGNMVGQMYN